MFAQTSTQVVRMFAQTSSQVVRMFAQTSTQVVRMLLKGGVHVHYTLGKTMYRKVPKNVANLLKQILYCTPPLVGASRVVLIIRLCIINICLYLRLQLVL